MRAGAARRRRQPAAVGAEGEVRNRPRRRLQIEIFGLVKEVGAVIQIAPLPITKVGGAFGEQLPRLPGVAAAQFTIRQQNVVEIGGPLFALPRLHDIPLNARHLGRHGGRDPLRIVHLRLGGGGVAGADAVCDQQGDRRQQADQQQERRQRPAPRPPSEPAARAGLPRLDRAAREERPQVVGELQGRPVAVARVALHGLAADGRQVGRQPRRVPVERRRIAAADEVQRFAGRSAAERRPAGQQLVKNRTKSVNIAARTDVAGAAPGLFRRQVTGRLLVQLHVGGVAFDGPAGQAKVADLRQAARRSAGQVERRLDRRPPPCPPPAAGGGLGGGAALGKRLQPDAGGAQAAVDDALFVGGVDAAGQHFDEASRLARRHRLGRSVLGQRRPRDPFDGVVKELTLAFAGLQDLHDVGMTEPAEGAGFAAQRPPAELAGVVAGHDDLEQNGTVDEQLLGLEQADAQRRSADLFLDLEPGHDRLAGRIAERRRLRHDRLRGGGDRVRRRRQVEQRQQLDGVAADRADGPADGCPIVGRGLPGVPLGAGQQLQHESSRNARHAGAAGHVPIIAETPPRSRRRAAACRHVARISTPAFFAAVRIRRLIFATSLLSYFAALSLWLM